MDANVPPQTSTAAPDSDSHATDGPVLIVINKRLRALRKKHKRIIKKEDSVAQGKVLQKVTEEMLKSKPVVLGQIEELEKLKEPLAAAVAEEHTMAVNKYLESEKEKESSVSVEEECAVVEERDEESVIGVVGDVLNLVYFGSIFDVKTHSELSSMMLTRTHERGCCLTYDHVTDDAVDPLGEKDLDFISQVGSFLTSRPIDSILSHKDALERCVEHAKLWLAKSAQPIGPDTSITYAGLRERLDKIMASEYFTTTPEMKAPVDVAYSTTTPEMKAPVDVAAASAGNAVTYELPVQGYNAADQGESSLAEYMKAPVDVAAASAGNSVTYELPVQGYNAADQGESSLAEYLLQDVTDDLREQQIVDNLFSNEEEELEVAGYHSNRSSQQVQGYTQTESEQNIRNFLRYLEQRDYQNPIGGGGGFRGGPHHSGGNRYYDQHGNYNYPGRGRGPGGGFGGGPHHSGGNQYYDQHGIYNYPGRGRGPGGGFRGGPHHSGGTQYYDQYGNYNYPGRGRGPGGQR